MTGNANDRVWFYYAREQQIGPLKEGELKQALTSGELGGDDFVFREGYPDWKKLKDVPELNRSLLASTSVVKRPIPTADKRHKNRAPIHEQVVAHNDNHVASGIISDISVTGLFLETRDSTFGLNDEVKLVLKEGRGLGKPMNLRAVVVRQARDNRFPMGYGLELRGLDESARARIQDYLKKQGNVS